MFWSTKKKTPFVAALPESHNDGKIDIYSSTWSFVKDKVAIEIEKARAKNDNQNLTETQTAVIRGKIKALKSVLKWPEEKGILNR